MPSGAGKSAAFMLSVLNLILYLIVLTISGWAVNHGIVKSRESVASLSIPLHIFPIYFPFGNMATGFLVIFSLIAGSVGFMTSLANINNVFHWNPSNLQAAAASSLTTWLLTMLAMGVACKEISLGWTDSNLRTLETILIVLSGTQLFCYGTIHMGVEDAVTRQRTGRGRFM